MWRMQGARCATSQVSKALPERLLWEDERSYLLGGAFVLPPPEGFPVVLGQPPGPFEPPPLFPPPPLLPPLEPLLIVSSLGLQMK